VIGFWVAATVAAMIWLPTIGQQGGGALGALAPHDAAALRAERISATRFAFPLLSRTAIVQRAPHGLSLSDQARAVRLAARLTRHQVSGYSDILGALAISNAFGGPPFSRERSTTIITYLFFTPSDSAGRRATIADRLLRTHVLVPSGGSAGVTGEAPAHVEQSDLIHDHLAAVSVATVLLVALILAARFRSVIAPLMTLFVVGVAYLVSEHVVAEMGYLAGLAVPQEVEPVMVVLILGIVTDYSVFFLSRLRRHLVDCSSRMDAARRTALAVAPLVLIAGLTVAVATGGLAVAHLAFFRVFGPGLAATVLICLAVVLTLVPALMACGGDVLFWPSVPAGREPKGGPSRERARIARLRTVSFACSHPWPAVVICLVLLGAAASGLYMLRLSNPVVRGLPRTSGAHAAYRAATRAFAPGVISPTVILVGQRGVSRHRAALAQLQSEIADQPGIALVLGPGDNPFDIAFGASLAPSGNDARYFVVLDSDALGAQAISSLRHLEKRMPTLLARAGLRHASASYAGDTALSAETINDTLGDLGRVAPISLLAMLIILVIYLRALVAPLYLIAASMLSFAAALGIGTWVFQGALHQGGLSFFIPFITAVLLVSLGSDYNVFLIGNVWQEARRVGLKAAVPIGAAESARAITLAGVILASSFALLAIIPLQEFRQVALVMAAGLILDTMLVRTILVPALITIVGSASTWPSRRWRDTKVADTTPTSALERGRPTTTSPR
jgi:RND superfamily putative drug exporter